MADRQHSTWQARVARQFKAQPARTAVMVVLMGTMALLWGKHFTTRGSARPASASNTPAVTDAPTAPAEAGPQTLSRTAAALREFLEKPPVEVRHNLFAVRLEHFPVDGTGPAEKMEGGGFLGNWAKWIVSKADQEKARRFLIVNLKEQASKLNIQSTMTSDATLRALINGKLVSEGDVVAEFKIVRIEANRIFVEREGVKFEIPFGLNR